jgi:membrane-bound ClpP family serine protease
MFSKCTNKFLCISAALLALVLIGLGVFLLATGFALEFITIGLIIGGILLLILCCCFKCLDRCVLCLFLALITLFLIISGILAIFLAGAFVIGLILIGLGVIALLITVICLIERKCKPKHYPPSGCN